MNSTTANIFKQIADLYKACFWRRCWSIQEALSSVVVVTGLTSHVNTICRLALNNMSFHLDICVTTNLLHQRPTASINIHTWITYSYSCLSFWVHAIYQSVISLQIWYKSLLLYVCFKTLLETTCHFIWRYLCDDIVTSAETNSLNKHSYMNHIFIFMSVFLSECFIPICYITPPDLILKSRPCFKQHVISFWRYLCDETVTSAETNKLNNIYMRIRLHTWTFIFMSLFLSACFIPICRIILPCLMLIAFIYTFVCSNTCRLFWDHALQLPYWKFAVPLCLMLLLGHLACRRRPKLHERPHPDTDNGVAST